MKTEITVHQKIKKIAPKYLRALVDKAASILKLPPGRLSLVLCDDAMIQRLNKKYFKRNVPTDVIAFPLCDEKYFGEIIISVERALKAAPQYGNSWEEEFTLYLIHGILHLLGYDDTTLGKKRLMFKKQDQIFKSIVDSQ